MMKLFSRNSNRTKPNPVPNKPNRMRLTLQTLEDRCNPSPVVPSSSNTTDNNLHEALVAQSAQTAPVLVIGRTPGDSPWISIRTATGELGTEIQAYADNFTGGIHVAQGDVNGDGVKDILTAVRSGGSPHVKVFDGKTHSVIRSFYAFDVNFTGGVFIASADINNDGFADIVTGAGYSGSPHVKVFSGKDGAILKSFFAYTPNITMGVRVTAGDVNGDGFAEIVTSPGEGAGPHVKVFDGKTGNVVNQFFAYAPNYTGGVFVTLADRDLDGDLDLFTGADTGTNPHVKVFNALTGQVIESFYVDQGLFWQGLGRLTVIPNERDGLHLLHSFEAVPGFISIVHIT